MNEDDFNKLLNSWSQDIIFSFRIEEYKYIIIGYPVLRAFSCNENIFVEYVPAIDLTKRKILFSQAEMKRQPSNQLDLFYDEPQRLESERRFFKLIPEPVRNRIKIFGDCHLEFLRAQVYCGTKLEDLIDSNPALAYIAVNLENLNTSFKSINSMELINRLTLLKRKEILEKALFPATDRMIGILKKTDPGSLSVNRFIQWQWLLSKKSGISDKIYNLIDMLEVLDNNFFFALNNVEKIFDICSTILVKKLILNNNPELNYKNLRKIWKLKKSLRIKVPEIRSIKGINKTLTDLLLENEKINFPPNPPVIGNDQIIPLCTSVQIREWSKVQNNCISTYVGQVMRGTSYFYKVNNGNEEGTLELKINKVNNSIQKGALLCTNNKMCSEEMRLLVNNWFTFHMGRK